jgi:hypothetical protein
LDSLRELARANNLIAIKVHFIKPAESNTYKSRPIWTRLDVAELEAIHEKAAKGPETKGEDAKDKGALASSTELERVIHKLDKAVSFAVFRKNGLQNVVDLNKLQNVFLGSMYLCALYREFWVLQRQVNDVRDP